MNRALRSGLWAPLRARGFTTRTDRIGWRYVGDSIDLIEVNSIGPLADAVGCTSYSFGATVASLPPYQASRFVPAGPDGRPRPHYWHCELRKTLSKSLRQPWFRPFSAPVNPRLAPGMLGHREGLKGVIRGDAHDRADTWFVRDDGSNLDEDIVDLLAAVETEGLPLLETFHDPCAVARILRAEELWIVPSSPAGQELIAAALDACAEGA